MQNHEDFIIHQDNRRKIVAHNVDLSGEISTNESFSAKCGKYMSYVNKALLHGLSSFKVQLRLSQVQQET